MQWVQNQDYWILSSLSVIYLIPLQDNLLHSWLQQDLLGRRTGKYIIYAELPKVFFKLMMISSHRVILINGFQKLYVNLQKTDEHICIL